MRAEIGLALVLASCGRIDFGELADAMRDGAIGGDGGSGDAALGVDACALTTWSTPVPIGGDVNTAGIDWEPALSPDGKTLVFGRQAASGQLFVATGSIAAGFTGSTMILADVNNNAGAAWSPAGDQLFFVSDRVLLNNFHLYVSAFDGTNFGTPVEVAELASESVNGPTISSTGLELFYNESTGDGAQIERAVRTSTTQPWAIVGDVAELNTTTDGWATLAQHDLTIFWESERSNPIGSIYTATRAAIGGTFSTPQAVPVITDSGDQDGGDPDATADGNTLLFDSLRPGGLGQNDIYVATRACQ